jgi:hypothetical protein
VSDYDNLSASGPEAEIVECLVTWRGMGEADLSSPSMLFRRLVVSEKDSLGESLV